MKSTRVFDGQRNVIVAIFVASIFVNLLILTAPLYMLQLFSRVLASGSMATLIALTTGAAIALVFFFLFDAIRQRLVNRLGTRLEARLNPIVLTGMVGGTVPPELRSSQPIRDIQDVRGFVTSPIFIALLDVPWSFAFVALIFVFSPILGIVSVIGISILLGLGILNELIGRAPDRDAAEAARDANSSVEEMMHNAEIIHAMGKTRVQVERWTVRSFSAIVFGTIASDRVAFMTSAAKFVRMALQIAVLGVGVVLVTMNQLTPGLMIATSILLGRAAAPMEQSIAGWRGLLGARAARDRLNVFLAHLDQEPERMEMPEPEGYLSVENATVMLPDRQNPVVFDVSFNLKPGESLGLIGPSGAGKTTLAKALVNLQPLARGHIRIDDAALTDWNQEQIGTYTGFLPQRVELFKGTIAENIAMMDPNAKPSDIVAAAKLANVHQLILQLPGGYNAEVGPRGEFLSAGQRQRIGLARAFFGDRKLIVLDEPNANLDPEGEAALAQAIQSVTERGAIVVVVTHRMNLLRCVTHAALLQDGRLARFGAARDIIDAVTQPLTKPDVTDPKVAVLRKPSEPTGSDQNGNQDAGAAS